MTIREGLEKDARKFVNSTVPTVFYDIEGNKQLLFKNDEFTGYKQTDTSIVHVIWKKVKCMSVTVQLHHTRLKKFRELGLLCD